MQTSKTTIYQVFCRVVWQVWHNMDGKLGRHFCKARICQQTAHTSTCTHIHIWSQRHVMTCFEEISNHVKHKTRNHALRSLLVPFPGVGGLVAPHGPRRRVEQARQGQGRLRRRETGVLKFYLIAAMTGLYTRLMIWNLLRQTG